MKILGTVTDGPNVKIDLLFDAGVNPPVILRKWSMEAIQSIRLTVQETLKLGEIIKKQAGDDYPLCEELEDEEWVP